MENRRQHKHRVLMAATVITVLLLLCAIALHIALEQKGVANRRFTTAVTEYLPDGSTRTTESTAWVPGLELKPTEPLTDVNTLDLTGYTTFYRPWEGYHIPPGQYVPTGDVYYDFERVEYVDESDNTVQVDKSIVRCYIDSGYEEDELLWTAEVEDIDLVLCSHCAVSDGVVMAGSKTLPRDNDEKLIRKKEEWLIKLDSSGNLLWQQRLDSDFEDQELVMEILEESDGCYSVFYRVDGDWFGLNRYTADGEKIYSNKVLLGPHGIYKVMRHGDGYIICLSPYFTQDGVLLVDKDGNIAKRFDYSGVWDKFFLNDVEIYGDKLYISGEAYPKYPWEDERTASWSKAINYTGREEYGDDFTNMVQKNYTALLLVCDLESGQLEQIYSASGAQGMTLSVDNEGSLVWDVEFIFNAFYCGRSSHALEGYRDLFEYSFDESGALIGGRKTGIITGLRS